MRLNLGCGHLPLEGFTNVDLHAEEADIRGDIRSLQFRDVEEVVMHHILEHLERKDTVAVLQRIRSWMLNRTPITVEVPDMEELMANPRLGWERDVYGSQEHEGEFHKNGFTTVSLDYVLRAAGFSDIELRKFESTHEMRPGMACLEARAKA